MQVSQRSSGISIWAQRLSIVAFVVLISSPGMGLLLQGSHRLEDQSEKRRLASFPRWEWSQRGLRSFPVRFDAYFQDHFAGRRQLIRWNSLVGVHWLGMTPTSLASQQGAQLVGEKLAGASTDVVSGKQGWLFFTGSRVIDDYRCVTPFTRGQLAAWAETLAARRRWLEAQGIQFLLVVAPNKHTIYPEQLPRSINRLRDQSRLDQLLAELARQPNFPVLDLREPLRQSKQTERCYHLTDTHWNDYGAWIAYTEIMQGLAHRRPELQPWDRSRFDLHKTDRPGGDLAIMLGLQDLIREEWYDMVPRGPRSATIEPQSPNVPERLVTVHPDQSLPRAVVFRDSYFGAVQPFFSEHFSRVVYSWTYDFEADLIEQERPQVVVQEILERSFMGLKPQNPPQVSRATGPLAKRAAPGKAEASPLQRR